MLTTTRRPDWPTVAVAITNHRRYQAWLDARLRRDPIWRAIAQAHQALIVDDMVRERLIRDSDVNEAHALMGEMSRRARVMGEIASREAGDPRFCSMCRSVHGREVEHACE